MLVTVKVFVPAVLVNDDVPASAVPMMFVLPVAFMAVSRKVPLVVVPLLKVTSD